MEEKVDGLTDTLADQFAQLTLLMKKKTKTEVNNSTYDHLGECGLHNCSNCNRLGPSATSCNENTHYNAHRRRCRKFLHIRNSCWVRNPLYLQDRQSGRNLIGSSQYTRTDQKDSVGFVAEGCTEVVAVTKHTVTRETKTKDARISVAPLQNLLIHMPVRLSKESSFARTKNKKAPSKSETRFH